MTGDQQKVTYEEFFIIVTNWIGTANSFFSTTAIMLKFADVVFQFYPVHAIKHYFFVQSCHMLVFHVCANFTALLQFKPMET